RRALASKGYGNRYSTAENPTLFAAAKRSRNGRSPNSIVRFAANSGTPAESIPQIYGFASQVVSGNLLDGSVGNRQCDRHRRAPANLAHDLQITIVILGDAAGDRQTETTATSGRLAGAHEFTHDL